MILVFFKGFVVSAGLIIAIGAQNAFVLTQGIKRQHWLIIPLICAVCDALLISAGVAGMGTIVSDYPEFTRYVAWGGAAFLFWYGFKSLQSVFRPGTLEESNRETSTVGKAVATTLALTFLNPHVYIDTVLLIGTIGSQFPDGEKFLFAAGAMSASFVWFFMLSFGGRLLKPMFQKTVSWQILDSFVCATMIFVGVSLII
ncbi:putative amino acid transport protein (LysE family) [Desulfamplus magnetovallimortis]|uniref:Putative amino acid transport protein (LysE family) n=2 Tax=Desulfamplus magnetovallimortis TaxID=1246637 RepID=A0A1W1HHU1_9BACT|nr:putative amino acid transport protein (LysE family) [Desulfamplus magnetovallimortis]